MSAQDKLDDESFKLKEEMNSEITEERVEDILLEPVTQVVVPEENELFEAIESKDEKEDQEAETQNKKSSRTSTERKRAAKVESLNISRIEEQLKTQSDQSKRINVSIKTIQKQLKELNMRDDIALHPVIKDLQEQLKTIERKIVVFDRLVKPLEL